MCDPVTAAVVVGSTVAANQFILKPQKEAAKAQAQAMQQQQQAMQEQQQRFNEAMEQRPTTLTTPDGQKPVEAQRQELAVQEARRRSRAQRLAASGYQSTMLTGGQGVTSQASTVGATLLGGTGGQNGQAGKTSLGA